MSTTDANVRSKGAVASLALLALTAISLFAALSAQAATPPVVLHDYASAITATAATVNAEIRIGGPATTECRFQYGTGESYGSAVSCDPTASITDRVRVRASSGQFRLVYAGEPTADLPFDATPIEIKAALEALPALTPLLPSLSVSGGPGGYKEALPPPYVISFSRPLSIPSQELLAEPGTEPLLDSHGGSGGLGSAETLPPAEVVHAQIGGLAPATTYHFRLDLVTIEGSAAGKDARLHTYANSGQGLETCPNADLRQEQHATFLPDCRAYEMVSPPEKRGANIAAVSGRTRAAPDGNAVGFTSLGAFAGAEGTGILVDYLAERQGNPGPLGTGWLTHPITPRQLPNTYRGILNGWEPHYTGDFDAAFNDGVFAALSPLTDEPGVGKALNLYLRTDLRSPGPGHYTLLTACPRCVETGTELPTQSSQALSEFARVPLDGASPDFSHVAFEDMQRLTADAPAASRIKAYEWVNGKVALAGRIPASGTECDDLGTPACKPAAESIFGSGILHGSNLVLTPHILSDGADGHSRAFITFPTQNGVTPPNQSGAGRAGVLYVREDGHRTIQLNTPDPGAPQSSFQPAEFQDASTNGERAFFTTQQPLTKDSPDSTTEVHLYMWSAAPNQSGGHLTYIGNAVKGVIGASVDGSYLYFMSSNQLVAGASPLEGGTGIFLWHEGTVFYVGRSEGTDGELAWPGTFEPQSRVTPDGTHLLFTSQSGSGLTGYDQGDACGKVGPEGCTEFYLYDASLSTPIHAALQCVSCRPDLAPPSANAVNDIRELSGAGGTDLHQPTALSEDGRYVFFSTVDALVPGDTNGVSDAYEYDSQTEEVHLLSSGTDPHPSFFLDASADGRNVFIDTAQRLVGWDRDEAYDLYDVRIDGGFPEPAARSAACSSADTCKEGISPAPAPATVGSDAHFPGNETAPARERCPKGKRTRKVQGRTVCMKPKKKHASGHRRSAR